MTLDPFSDMLHALRSQKMDLMLFSGHIKSASNELQRTVEKVSQATADRLETYQKISSLGIKMILKPRWSVLTAKSCIKTQTNSKYLEISIFIGNRKTQGRSAFLTNVRFFSPVASPTFIASCKRLASDAWLHLDRRCWTTASIFLRYIWRC